MKLVTILLGMIVSTISYAAEQWEVKPKQHEYVLYKKDNKDIKFELTNYGGTPYFSRLEEKNGLELIIYYAGSAGTQYQVEVYHAVIYDKERKKILGDYPFKYESSDYEVDQPKWTFTNKKIKIIDFELGIEETINY